MTIFIFIRSRPCANDDLSIDSPGLVSKAVDIVCFTEPEADSEDPSFRPHEDAVFEDSTGKDLTDSAGLVIYTSCSGVICL